MRIGAWGLGFRVEGLGFRVGEGVGGVSTLGKSMLRVQGALGFFRVEGLAGLRGLGSREGLGFGG